MSHSEHEVETTGHVWDDDLREYSNPLPRWWLWAFYATIAFSVVYWVMYPTWPVASGWTQGMATVDVGGVKKPWSTRALLEQEMKHSQAAMSMQKHMEQLVTADLDEVAKNPELLQFTRAVGKVLFADNCAACHGQGAQGVIGLYPNLADDDWLYGGTAAAVQASITKGRNGIMTPMKNVLTPEEIADVGEYVLSLSGETDSSEQVVRGEAIFRGKGTCVVCHGADAKGVQMLGGANLTDKIWTIIDIPSAADLDAKRALVKHQIENGVMGTRVMPAWSGRLSESEIKALTAYVRQLGQAQ